MFNCLFDAMYFRQILHEERACASYIVGCPTIGVCAVVDPQGDPQKYMDQVEDNAMALKCVIETHVHADHISTARELASLSKARLCYGPDADVTFDHETLHDGEVLQLGKRTLRVMHTPGHTPEHICILGDDWYLLTGDTFFVNDAGRVDLSLVDISREQVSARAETLYESLQKLLELPDYIELYPGHFSGSLCGRGMEGKPSSTIGFERRHNAALLLSRDEFRTYQVNELPPLPADFYAIKRHNLGQDSLVLVPGTHSASIPV